MNWKSKHKKNQIHKQQQNTETTSNTYQTETEIIATIPIVTPSKDRKVLSRLFKIANHANRTDSVRTLINIFTFKNSNLYKF